MVYAIVCVITLIAIGAVLAHFMIWEEDIAAILSVYPMMDLTISSNSSSTFSISFTILN